MTLALIALAHEPLPVGLLWTLGLSFLLAAVVLALAFRYDYRMRQLAPKHEEITDAQKEWVKREGLNRPSSETKS